MMKTIVKPGFKKASFEPGQYVVLAGNYAMKGIVMDDDGQIIPFDRMAFKSQMITFIEHVKAGIPYTIKSMPVNNGRGHVIRKTIATYDGQKLSVCLNRRQVVIPFEDSEIDPVSFDIQKDIEIDTGDKGYVLIKKAHANIDTYQYFELFFISDF